MKHTKLASLLLALTMTTGLCSGIAAAAEPGAEQTAVINHQTQWTYNESGIDPAGDASAAGYDRTSWTKAGYDTTDWKTGAPSFGAKKGSIADLGDGCTPNTLLTQYKEDHSDIEAYFFRTTVQVDDPTAVTSITGSVLYDDAATVYINGTKIAGFDDDNITANIQYGGSNAAAPKTGNISITENASSLLVQGENVVAVEIHQGRAESSDIYFDMPELTFGTEPITPAAPEQNSVSVSIGADESQRNFTWYCDQDGEGTLLVAKADAVQNGQMPADAKAYTTTGTATNMTGFYSYQTTAYGLEHNTRYAYQMVNGETKTEISYITTGGGNAFSFAFAGDPQIGASGSTVNDTDGWDKTLSLIASNTQLSGVDFLLSAGDQVNTADNEDQYSGYLKHDELLDLPVATVVGNHDSGSAAYDQHFNVPNESAYGATAASRDYYFVYNHVLFMALNSNNRSTAEHKAFMEQAIAATANQDITWKIVTFHHSIYSVASHAVDKDILARRDELAPVFKELDIDVVLMGHDHVYCRTYMMDGLEPMTDASIYDDADYSAITNPTGILYVTANSASGSKFYTIKTDLDFPYSKVLNQERVPNISRVDVSDNAFTITTYRTSDMSVVDTFTINHKQAYNVAVSEAKHGTVNTDLTNACAGDTVKLTAAPAEGYKLTGWKVTCNGEDVAVAEDGSFIMPEGDVTVEAVFEHIHTYSDSWSYDETNHWHDCTEADGGQSDKAAHDFVWVIDQAAEVGKTGLKHEACTVCGAVRNENTVIAALEKPADDPKDDASKPDNGSNDQKGDASKPDNGSNDQKGDASKPDNGSNDQKGDVSKPDNGSNNQNGNAQSGQQNNAKGTNAQTTGKTTPKTGDVSVPAVAGVVLTSAAIILIGLFVDDRRKKRER